MQFDGGAKVFIRVVSVNQNFLGEGDIGFSFFQFFQRDIDGFGDVAVGVEKRLANIDYKYRIIAFESQFKLFRNDLINFGPIESGFFVAATDKFIAFFRPADYSAGQDFEIFKSRFR